MQITLNNHYRPKTFYIYGPIYVLEPPVNKMKLHQKPSPTYYNPSARSSLAVTRGLLKCNILFYVKSVKLKILPNGGVPFGYGVEFLSKNKYNRSVAA